ncbi:aromatic-ring-hydroxylating dioxygenase subunit beta [Nocardia sp. NPDC051900]|uniref:aromatic-ring-hydroxylating dioxygenase subunit beta n=1 Tax=Nocardia sp. NPDC051900 TaxID=3364326 RepID=UPI0037B11A4D
MQLDAELRSRIIDFYSYETELLDDRRFTEWMAFLADEFVYQIPTTFTPDNPSGSAWSERTLVVDETRESLANLWAVRYTPELVEFAWGENPAQRVRRFVTGTRAVPGGEPDTYTVRSNVLLSFVRQSDPPVFVPARAAGHPARGRR